MFGFGSYDEYPGNSLSTKDQDKLEGALVHNHNRIQQRKSTKESQIPCLLGPIIKGGGGLGTTLFSTLSKYGGH